jgi:putative phosphoesterase
MRIATLYDIHGNLPALEAVLDDVARSDVDRIIIGGDVVPGPMPKETLARLQHRPEQTQFIRGNGEVAVLREMEGADPGVPVSVRPSIRWNADQLSKSDREFLAGWPLTLQVQIEGLGEVLFCHATPKDVNPIFTCLTPADRLKQIFGDVHASTVICGHTHMQFDRTVDGIRVVNAGSVGMPFGKPGACWLLLGNEIEFRRTEYDLEATAMRIRKTSYPEAESFATNNVLAPPSEERMLRLFERGSG